MPLPILPHLVLPINLIQEVIRVSCEISNECTPDRVPQVEIGCLADWRDGKDGDDSSVIEDPCNGTTRGIVLACVVVVHEVSGSRIKFKMAKPVRWVHYAPHLHSVREWEGGCGEGVGGWVR